MPDLNRVFLLGRLTRDPTLRHTPGGTPVAEFGIAVNRTWSGPDGDRREETCFVDIVVWSRRAEVCHGSLKKGSPVFLEGRLHLDTWESQSGDKRSRLKVVANNVIFLNPPPRGGRGGPPRGEGRRGGSSLRGGSDRQREDAPGEARETPDAPEPPEAREAGEGSGSPSRPADLPPPERLEGGPERQPEEDFPF